MTTPKSKGGPANKAQPAANPASRPGKQPSGGTKAKAADGTGRTQQELEAIFESIQRYQAVIEYSVDGTILHANQNLLDAMGYELDDILGQHHSIFVHPDYRDSGEYQRFWERLRAGEFISREFQRTGKGGKDVYIQATYNPIQDGQGNTVKVINFCTDITARKLEEKSNAESQEWFAMEVQRIAESCERGELDARGDTDGLNDLFRPLMESLNGVLDRLVEPVRRTAGFLAEIAEGGIPDELEESVQGDFKTMQDSLNWLIMATKAITDIAVRIGQGDMTVEVQVRSDNDQLLQALQTMADQLNDSLCSIRGTARSVLDQSRGVSTDSQSLSQSAAESAASLEQISSSMEELASQTRSNADNAKQAMQLAIGARDAATQGDEQMRQMVAAMQDIEEASASISKIIKVIDEIAFQTNLLALNAAVEAARAGVHGKGFAVVAEEVRNLAARSATAARETTELIEGSVKKVTNGMDIANSTATALGEIVRSVSKAADLVSEISAASSEQSEGIDQVNVGITQVDHATQQNTASADRMSASAMQLKSQAEALLETVGRFTLLEPEAPQVSGEVPNEVLQLLEQILMGNGPSGVEQLKTALSGVVGEARAAQTRGAQSQPPQQPVGATPQGVDPADVIRLDDAEFGRYGR